MFKQIKRILERKFAGQQYSFTFQDCSLFDGRIGEIPHFVYTDHTVLENRRYPEFDEKRDLLTKEWILLERSIYENATMVFTRYDKVSRSIVNDYHCPPDKVRTVYFAPYLEDDPGTHNRDKYLSKNILFIGMDWERKGGPELLKAFKRVRHKIPEAQLTIVGCTPRTAIPSVSVVGKVDKALLSEYYENAAVFCFPTRKEHAGIVVVEAIRYRLPIVGTPIGALSEYIDNGVNGYLVDVGDVKKLADRLVWLLNEPAICEKMGDESYRMYQEKFTLEVISSKFKKYIGGNIE
jgi:glycosyltransferase involved in cell wall biosynthesis